MDRNHLIPVIGYHVTKQQAIKTTQSSAAQYLTFVSATGDSPDSIEVRYEDYDR